MILRFACGFAGKYLRRNTGRPGYLRFTIRQLQVLLIEENPPLLSCFYALD